MAKKNNPFIVDGFYVEGYCRKDSYFVPFFPDDVHLIERYVHDLDYKCEVSNTMKMIISDRPTAFKVMMDNHTYGWIKKIREKVNGVWEDHFIYGYYKDGWFHRLYLITDRITDTVARTQARIRTITIPQTTIAFNDHWGIPALEGKHPSILDSVISMMYGLKFTTT